MEDVFGPKLKNIRYKVVKMPKGKKKVVSKATPSKRDKEPKWTDCKEDDLIDLLEQHPILFYLKLPEYHDSVKKQVVLKKFSFGDAFSIGALFANSSFESIKDFFAAFISNQYSWMIIRLIAL